MAALIGGAAASIHHESVVTIIATNGNIRNSCSRPRDRHCRRDHRRSPRQHRNSALIRADRIDEHDMLVWSLLSDGHRSGDGVAG